MTCHRRKHELSDVLEHVREFNLIGQGTVSEELLDVSKKKVKGLWLSQPPDLFMEDFEVADRSERPL